MKKYIQIIFVFLIHIISIPNLFSLIPREISVSTLNNPSPGYLFLDASMSNNFSLIDNSGYEVHESSLAGIRGIIQNVTVQPNGLVSFYCRDQFSNVEKFYIMNDKYEIVDSICCTSQYNTDYHEFKILSTGNYLLMGMNSRTIDMSQIVHDGNQAATVIGYILQEFDSHHRLVWEWNTFDHFQITDVVDTTVLVDPTIDYVHCNSFCEDNDGNILLSSRHFDEITKINHSTGEIMWRMGGSYCKNNQFSFINDLRNNYFGFSSQHDISILPNGHLLLFDNKSLNEADPSSRAVEYEINEFSKTITKVWEYRHTPSVLSFSQGSVQRLSNGNSLICWGGNFQNILVTEIDPASNIVFEISGTNYSSYRAYRFVFKMAAVTKNINSFSTYDFNESNNQTNITLLIDSLDGSGDATIEAHDYEAHNLAYNDIPEPAYVFPARWVMTVKTIRNLKGIIKFDIESIDAISNPELLMVLHRAKEGLSGLVLLRYSGFLR